MENETTGAVDNGDAFTAEESALFDAQMGAGGTSEAAGGSEAPAGGEAAPVASVAPAGDAAAPGEVVDPDLDGEDDGEDNKGRFVRHGAFHQARQRYKAEKAARVALEAQVTELREQYARADERLRVAAPSAAAAAAQAAPEPETPPDPNEDIFGYAKYLEKQIQDIRAGQTQLTEAQKVEQAQRAEAAERNEVLSSYRGDVQRVLAAKPEFAQAYEHLMTGRIAELKLLGVPEQDAVQAVRDEEFGIAQAAIRAGQSPAERLMQLATLRGFAPKAAAPAAAQTETAVEKADRISRGQAASKSLSAAGGAPAGELTMEMLANMSEAEFEKVSAANPARVRALMGG